MKAAVVDSFGSDPVYAEFAEPKAKNTDDILLDVLAAGLHPRVRSQANGSHYTSTDELPLVPGFDGVGRDTEGHLRYFLTPDTTIGSMAEKTLINKRKSVILPEDSDVNAVAAAMNPAMSSWIALRRRVKFHAGQNVLILGATGNAGRMAIQVSKLFGANKIIGAARNEELLKDLPSLGATQTVLLSGDQTEVSQQLGKAATDVDVVIDYLWGDATEKAIIAIVRGRADKHQTLTWIQIGSVAGATAQIPSAALRSSGLTIVGSGQRSVSAKDIVAELPDLAKEITKGTFDVSVTPMPLSEVNEAWKQSRTSRKRIVLIPNSSSP